MDAPDIIDLCGDEDEFDLHEYHNYLDNAFPERDYPNASGANHVQAAQPYIDDLHRNQNDLIDFDLPDYTPAVDPHTPGSSTPEPTMGQYANFADVCLSQDRPNDSRLY